jgi:hypothetical protein
MAALTEHRIDSAVGFGSIASFWLCADDFRSTPMNRHSQCPPACLKGANSGKEAALFDHLISEQSGRNMAVGNQVWGERS